MVNSKPHGKVTDAPPSGAAAALGGRKENGEENQNVLGKLIGAWKTINQKELHWCCAVQLASRRHWVARLSGRNLLVRHT